MARQPRGGHEIRRGAWRTLETHWSSAEARFYFRQPAGARIKLRYGFGWLGADRQAQTLDGRSEKVLNVGGVWGLSRSRVQIKLERDAVVHYEYEPIGP